MVHVMWGLLQRWHWKLEFYAMQKKIEGDKRLCKKLPDGGERVTKRRKHIEVRIVRNY